MPFRNVGQGKRCRECAQMDEERLYCVSLEEKHALAAKKELHLKGNDADRKVSVRGNTLSENAAEAPSSDGVDQIIKVHMDGMDQAKFRQPRNLASSAEFASLWRPQLHVVGGIAWGHTEFYFIMQTDIKKDSNMEATVLARILDVIRQKLEAEHPGAMLLRVQKPVVPHTHGLHEVHE